MGDVINFEAYLLDDHELCSFQDAYADLTVYVEDKELVFTTVHDDEAISKVLDHSDAEALYNSLAEFLGKK